MTDTLRAYLKNIAEITRRGDAREESYYSELKNLLPSATSKTIAVTILPKKTEGPLAGNSNCTTHILYKYPH